MSAAIGLAAVNTRVPFVAESEIGYRPVELNSNGYVSSKACKACHPREYGTWHDSYHRTMTQVATPETVRAEFDDPTGMAPAHGRPASSGRSS